MTYRLVFVVYTFLIVSCSSSKRTTTTDNSTLNERYLILTADDFGASVNINEGIKFAVENKSVTSISVLSNFEESLLELKEISENHPKIGIGVHLNIVTGKPILDTKQVPSLVNSDGNFYTIEALLPKIKSISHDDLRKELRAQILALKKYDIRIDHISDQCGILSYYSPFFEIVIELAQEFNLAVRSPVFASAKCDKLKSNSEMNKRYRQIATRCVINAPIKTVGLLKFSNIDEMEKKSQKLDELGILHPDILVECFWGKPTASNLLYILENLPSGTSEIILHLGTYSRQKNYPRGLDQFYFKNRENELITITSEYLKEYYEYLNIKTINYSEISKNQ